MVDVNAYFCSQIEAKQQSFPQLRLSKIPNIIPDIIPDCSVRGDSPVVTAGNPLRAAAGLFLVALPHTILPLQGAARNKARNHTLWFLPFQLGLWEPTTPACRDVVPPLFFARKKSWLQRSITASCETSASNHGWRPYSVSWSQQA